MAIVITIDIGVNTTIRMDTTSDFRLYTLAKIMFETAGGITL